LADADHVFGTVTIVSPNQKSIAVTLDSEVGIRTENGFLIIEALPLMRGGKHAPFEDLWGGLWALELFRRGEYRFGFESGKLIGVVHWLSVRAVTSFGSLAQESGGNGAIGVDALSIPF
jgi:hypothetical protein